MVVPSGLMSQQCRECKFLFACNGECPKNRFAENSKGITHNASANYLCGGYYQFFSHAAPAMDFMANQWRNKRSPANVMKCF
jgi:uncharacterized protein